MPDEMSGEVKDVSEPEERAVGLLLSFALVAFYFMMQIGVSVVLVVASVLSRGASLTDEAQFIALGRSGLLSGLIVLINAALMMPVIYGAVRGIERLPLWVTARFVAPKRVPAWLGIPIALLMAVMLDALTSLLKLPLVPRTLVDLYSERDLGLAVLILAVVFVAPFMEELLFRGLLFTSLQKRVGVVAAVVVITVLFGAIHVFTYGTDWYPVLQTVVMGLVLTLLRATTGSVWTGLIAHITNNLYSTIQILFWLQSN